GRDGTGGVRPRGLIWDGGRIEPQIFPPSQISPALLTGSSFISNCPERSVLPEKLCQKKQEDTALLHKKHKNYVPFVPFVAISHSGRNWGRSAARALSLGVLR